MTILLLRIEMSSVLASTIILLKLGRTLRKKFPNQGIQPKFYFKEVMVNSMFIEPVTDDEIYKVVISLNNSALGMMMLMLRSWNYVY